MKTSTTPRDLGEIRGWLEREARTLADARSDLTDGGDVRLERLDARVGDLCRAVETLPAAEARTLVDDLQQLNNALDDLAAAVWAAVRRNPGARIFPFQLGRP